MDKAAINIIAAQVSVQVKSFRPLQAYFLSTVDKYPTSGREVNLWYIGAVSRGSMAQIPSKVAHFTKCTWVPDFHCGNQLGIRKYCIHGQHGTNTIFWPLPAQVHMNPKLQALLFGSFLLTLPDLVTPWKRNHPVLCALVHRNHMKAHSLMLVIFIDLSFSSTSIC